MNLSKTIDEFPENNGNKGSIVVLHLLIASCFIKKNQLYHSLIQSFHKNELIFYFNLLI